MRWLVALWLASWMVLVSPLWGQDLVPMAQKVMAFLNGLPNAPEPLKQAKERLSFALDHPETLYRKEIATLLTALVPLCAPEKNFVGFRLSDGRIVRDLWDVYWFQRSQIDPLMVSLTALLPSPPPPKRRQEETDLPPADRLRVQSRFAPMELRGVMRALADVLDGKEVSKEQWDAAVSRWCPVTHPLRPLAETLRAIGETLQSQRTNRQREVSCQRVMQR